MSKTIRAAALDQSADFCGQFVAKNCRSYADQLELAEALLTQASSLLTALLGDPRETAEILYRCADEIGAPDPDRRRRSARS